MFLPPTITTPTTTITATLDWTAALFLFPELVRVLFRASQSCLPCFDCHGDMGPAWGRVPTERGRLCATAGQRHDPLHGKACYALPLWALLH
jgi:hypothetical protein